MKHTKKPTKTNSWFTYKKSFPRNCCYIFEAIMWEVSNSLNWLSHTCFINCDSKQEQRNYCQKIPQIWNSIYGKPQPFLTDHAAEFANRELLEMAEQLRINAMTCCRICMIQQCCRTSQLSIIWCLTKSWQETMQTLN